MGGKPVLVIYGNQELRGEVVYDQEGPDLYQGKVYFPAGTPLALAREYYRAVRDMVDPAGVGEEVLKGFTEAGLTDDGRARFLFTSGPLEEEVAVGIPVRIDWGDDVFYRAVLAGIEAAGRSRVAAQPGMSDADFLAGALAALKVLGLDGLHYPSSWTLGLMFTGKSPLRPEPKPQPPPEFKVGDQIAYVPAEARQEGKINWEHYRVEFGFVAGPDKGGGVYPCRYWRKNKPGELRTRANSELTEAGDLVLYRSVGPVEVQKALDWIKEQEK